MEGFEWKKMLGGKVRCPETFSIDTFCIFSVI